MTLVDSLTPTPEDQTKPLRRLDGFEVRHKDMARRASERRGYNLTADDFARDPALSCEGVMEHHGELITRRDGSTYVEWQGDDKHQYVQCSVCGFETSVAGPARARRIAEREGQPRTYMDF